MNSSMEEKYIVVVGATGQGLTVTEEFMGTTSPEQQHIMGCESIIYS